MKIEIKKDAIKTTSKADIPQDSWVVNNYGAIGQMKAWGVATVDMNHTPHDKSPMWKNHDEYVVFPDFAAACRWVADGSKPSDLYAITAISVVEMPALSFAIIATSPNGGNLPGDIVFKSGVNIINMTRDSGKVLDEDITIFPITVGDSITFIPEQEYHS